MAPVTGTPGVSSLSSLPYGGAYGSPYGYGSYGYGLHRLGGYGGYGYGGRNYGYGNNSLYFARMRRLSRLINDLNALTPGLVATAMHTNRLRNDLMGVSFGGARPPGPVVQQLSTDLATILPTRNVPMMHTAQLARDLEIVMNGSRHNGMQVQFAIGSASSVMHSSGVNRQGIQTVASDMRTVGSWGHLANPLARIP